MGLPEQKRGRDFSAVRIAGADRPAAGSLSAREWKEFLAPYCLANNKRAAVELLSTAVPFLVLWLAMWQSLHYSYWLCLALTPFTSLFLVRLFIIQHDCGHGAFFRQRRLNDWVGRIIGVATMTPYEYWRRGHALHHATSGNLDRRNQWDPPMLTLEEYRALGPWGRLGIRIVRNPFVLFGILPAYLFVLQYRLPVGFMRSGWRPWVSALGTTAAIASVATAISLAIGPSDFFLIQGPIVLLAASLGIWIIYVQHQSHTAYWARDGQWEHHVTALQGSSYYALPPVLNWMTANIGVHHVHHLNSRIPFYRLPEVLSAQPDLRSIGRMSLRASFSCANLALWDERNAKLVPFPRG